MEYKEVLLENKCKQILISLFTPLSLYLSHFQLLFNIL
nr:MAG TPA_asm: hypothetical protein [Caudoviricetes sp.]